MRANLLKTTAMALGLAAVAGCASNAPDPVTHDGLQLRPDTQFREVYVKPGASLEGFEAYGLADCQVAFRSNWLRDQNRDRVNLSNRVTQEDVDRIKDSLGALCDQHFREALTEPPPYNLVDEFENGERVLILQPSIVDLDVAAPDTRSPGVTRTYTTEAGEMTLFLEIRDATTNETLVRVVDRQRSPDFGRLQWTNGVTNSADAARILRRWTKLLREGLDSATGG